MKKQAPTTIPVPGASAICNLNGLPPRGADENTWNVIIETPQDSRNKYVKHATQSPSAIRMFNDWLERFSRRVTIWSGSSWAFALAVLVVVVWAITGPIFHYSDTWQLVINTGTTIVTFLMVFLIQRAQNKDALAIQLKLNELLASQQGASNRLINVEDMSEDEIIALHKRFSTLSQRLQVAEEDCSSHSITEAKEAAEEVEQTLEKAEQEKTSAPRS